MKALSSKGKAEFGIGQEATEEPNRPNGLRWMEWDCVMFLWSLDAFFCFCFFCSTQYWFYTAFYFKEENKTFLPEIKKKKLDGVQILGSNWNWKKNKNKRKHTITRHLRHRCEQMQRLLCRQSFHLCKMEQRLAGSEVLRGVRNGLQVTARPGRTSCKITFGGPFFW